MTSRTVEVHINALVLDGFQSVDRSAVADALRNELGNLFTNGAISPALERGAVTGSLDGGMFEVASPAAGAAVGYQIARALYGRLNA